MKARVVVQLQFEEGGEWKDFIAGPEEEVSEEDGYGEPDFSVDWQGDGTHGYDEHWSLGFSVGNGPGESGYWGAAKVVKLLNPAVEYTICSIGGPLNVTLDDVEALRDQPPTYRVPALPTNPEDEAVVDELMRNRWPKDS